MTEVKKAPATTVATTGPAGKPGQSKWEAPGLTTDNNTGLTNVSQELLDGPSKGRSPGLHAVALIEALKKVAEERDEQYARAEKLQQELDSLQEQLRKSRSAIQLHQTRNSALHAGLDFVRDLLQLLGVGELSHGLSDQTFSLRLTHDDLAYSAEWRFCTSRIGEFRDATFQVTSTGRGEICIHGQEVYLDDTGHIGAEVVSAIAAALHNSNPETFRENLTSLPASAFTGTYGQQHHDLMRIIRAADDQGSGELVEVLKRCSSLPTHLLMAALARAQSQLA